MAESSWKKQIEELYRARASLIILETVEEERAVAVLKQICNSLDCQLFACNLVEGIKQVGRSAPAGTPVKDPLLLLDQINKSTAEGIFILNDIHEYWNNPQVKRSLRNAAHQFKYLRKTLAVITPSVKLPDELRDEAEVVTMPLPNAEELDEVLDNLLRTPDTNLNLDKLGRERLNQSAAGLTAAQARRALARAIIEDGVLDERAIGIVLQEKKRVIAQSRALEYIDSRVPLDAVGGLDLIKHWAQQRSEACTAAARDYGLPSPKGVALIGVSGTGKSLAAKLFATTWQMPLLRLDVGSLFGSLVGESESATRLALRTVEAVSPCILWIDEIEKALARGGMDGGTSERVLGTFLTWMAEKKSPCFVVATANDISKLPPELLRKGRFDEVFFLDLPNLAERRAIFGVHIKQRRRNPRLFDIDELAQASTGYVGAEIEAAVEAALCISYNDGKRDVKTEDIICALKTIVPLSVSQREAVEGLRQWLRDGRARAASSSDEPDNSIPPTNNSAPIDIRPKTPTPKKLRNSSGGSP